MVSIRTYLNPLLFLEPLSDKSKPEIVEFFLIKDKTGKTHVAAEIRDTILSDVFIVPPNELRLSIDGEKPFTVWKFDSLPGGASNTDFVHDFYVSELVCGNYSCRRPVINLGFSLSGKTVFPQTSGKHHLDLWVSDFSGNQSQRSFDWELK